MKPIPDFPNYSITKDGRVWSKPMVLKRTITKQEEKLLRLVHHEFDGYSIDVAATKMGISTRKAKHILSKIKKIMPQFFPILTFQHRAILMMYDKHMSRASIAEGLDISKSKLERKVTFLREHGFLWNRKPDQYEPSMDGHVKEVF